MKLKSVLFGLAVLLCCTATALAQETGTISGAVLDPGGRVVAGATVRLTGDVMPAARNTVTSESGLYAFLQLLPGTYTIEIEKTGVGKVSRAAVVAVGRDTQVDVILGAQVTEAVTVSAAQPRVDLRSSEVSFNYRREFIQDLPLERSYLGLLQVIPGVADNGGFAPNGGGSRQDNVYLIDGVNITNPLFGYLSTEINELDILEMNAKRGAISAAAGRAQGFVSNVVTKSGTNRFVGSYRFEAVPRSWIAGSDKPVAERVSRYSNAAGLGGPLAQNKLFFYGSLRVFNAETARGTNVFGTIPAEKERTNEFFGKVTASLTNNLSVNVGYRHRPTEVDNSSSSLTEAPSVNTNLEGTNRVLSASADWFIGSRTTATVRYVRMDENSDTNPLVNLGFQPAFDVNNLDAMGRFTSNGVSVGGAAQRLNSTDYYRDEVKVDVTNFLDFGGMRHQIQVGASWEAGQEALTRASNGWGEVGFVTVGGQQRVRATYYPEQPTQLSKGRSYAFYAQDDINLTSRLVLNAGVLLNRDELIQDIPNITPGSNIETGTFLTFGFADQVQPRLGFNYQLRQNVGDKIYGNYGRYFGLDQKSGARSMASGRLFTQNTDFHPVTGALIETTVQANTAAKTIIRPIKSPHTDEFVLGYATPLADGWNFDAFWMYRDSDDFIEDIPSVLPFSSFVYTNDPNADRKFKTVTMELSRNMKNNWAMNVSYAWSKLYGNYDQDYSGGLAGASVFNTSSLINDGPGTFTADTNRQGVLSQDRTHVFKVLATYNPPRLENLTMGLTVRTQSGTPWAALGLSRGSGLTYLNYLEPAGTNRLPTWTNVDLLAKYSVKMGTRRALRLEARILNLFGNETVLLVDQRKFLDARNTTIPAPADTSCLSCWTDAWTAVQPTNQPNPAFGQGTNWAPPRRLLLSVLFDF